MIVPIDVKVPKDTKGPSGLTFSESTFILHTISLGPRFTGAPWQGRSHDDGTRDEVSLTRSNDVTTE